MNKGNVSKLRVKFRPLTMVELTVQMNPYHIRRDEYRESSLVRLLEVVLFILAGCVDDFWKKIDAADDKAWLKSNARTRRYIAPSPEELMPGKDKPVQSWGHALPNGYWIMSNIGKKEFMAILNMACKVASVRKEYWLNNTDCVERKRNINTLYQSPAAIVH